MTNPTGWRPVAGQEVAWNLHPCTPGAILDAPPGTRPDEETARTRRKTLVFVTPAMDPQSPKEHEQRDALLASLSKDWRDTISSVHNVIRLAQAHFRLGALTQPKTPRTSAELEGVEVETVRGKRSKTPEQKIVPNPLLYAVVFWREKVRRDRGAPARSQDWEGVVVEVALVPAVTGGSARDVALNTPYSWWYDQHSQVPSPCSGAHCEDCSTPYQRHTVTYRRLTGPEKEFLFMNRPLQHRTEGIEQGETFVPHHHAEWVGELPSRWSIGDRGSDETSWIIGPEGEPTYLCLTTAVADEESDQAPSVSHVWATLEPKGLFVRDGSGEGDEVSG